MMIIIIIIITESTERSKCTDAVESTSEVMAPSSTQLPCYCAISAPSFVWGKCESN